MLHLKSFIFTGILTLGVSAGALHHSAFATNNTPGTDTAIVLAQNSNSEGGFFSRIFNRKQDRDSAAKPLFLDKGGSSGGVKPYDFSRNYRNTVQRRNRAGAVDWNAFEDQRYAYIDQSIQQALAAGRAASGKAKQILEQRRQRMAAATGSPNPSGAPPENNKKMVYDPDRAWSYNPNERKQSGSPSRIYNSR